MRQPEGGRSARSRGQPPETSWAVMTVPAVNTPAALELERARAGTRRVAAVGEEGLLHRRAGRRRDRTLKVLPASSHSLLTSVTVTLASASMRSSQSGAPSAHSSAAAGETLKVCVVRRRRAHIVGDGERHGHLGQLGERVGVGRALLGGGVVRRSWGRRSPTAHDATVPSASVLPSVKVHIQRAHSGVKAAVGAWFPGAPVTVTSRWKSSVAPSLSVTLRVTV